jgi:hypothetical protein
VGERYATRTWATVSVAVATIIILLFAACGPDDQEEATVDDVEEALDGATADPEDRYDASFVGRVEGSDALIGLTPYEGNLLAYVCNGDPSQLGADASVAGWFDGPTNAGSFDLTSETGLRLEGEQTAAGFTGRVTLDDGTVHPFTAVAADDDEGLYREWLDTGGEQAGIIDIGWVAFDGVTTGSIKPIVITAFAPEVSGCPPLPPAYCR